MNVLGFTEEEKMSLFKTVAGILHFGNIEVKQRPREEWANIPTATVAEKASTTYTTCIHVLYLITVYVYMYM